MVVRTRRVSLDGLRDDETYASVHRIGVGSGVSGYDRTSVERRGV